MFQDYMMYGIVPNIKKCEENQNSFRSDRSSEDRNASDVLAIIVKSIQDEKEDEMFYKMLLESTVNKEDKEIIMTIRDDERKHRSMLKDVYKAITGKEFMNDNSNLEDPKMENFTYIQGLEKAFMGELAAFEKYRKVLMEMTDRELYNKIFEIMSDEMKHSIKYNYLITKNIK